MASKPDPSTDVNNFLGTVNPLVTPLTFRVKMSLKLVSAWMIYCVLEVFKASISFLKLTISFVKYFLYSCISFSSLANRLVSVVLSSYAESSRGFYDINSSRVESIYCLNKIY